MVLRRRFLGSLFQHGIDPNSDLGRSFFGASKRRSSHCNSNVFKSRSFQNGDFIRALNHPDPT
jgi:hypothetical protein